MKGYLNLIDENTLNIGKYGNLGKGCIFEKAGIEWPGGRVHNGGARSGIFGRSIFEMRGLRKREVGLCHNVTQPGNFGAFSVKAAI